MTSPVTIAGTADVFEAIVNIRIDDASGNVVAERVELADGSKGAFIAINRLTS